MYSKFANKSTRKKEIKTTRNSFSLSLEYPSEELFGPAARSGIILVATVLRVSRLLRLLVGLYIRVGARRRRRCGLVAHDGRFSLSFGRRILRIVNERLAFVEALLRLRALLLLRLRCGGTTVVGELLPAGVIQLRNPYAIAC